jgi:tetratricopeptide (TPR) repeat protein
MRILAALLVAGLSIAAAMPAPRAPETGRLSTPDAAPGDRGARLDQLFETLRTARDAPAARAAEHAILAIWNDSGSATVDLLMSWAAKAADQRDYAGALDFLDRVISLKPDYAEGWNKRATVYYLIDDYGKSIADIENVLKLEPRHFGALAGFGSILRDLGEDEKALAVYRRALDLDPRLDSVRKAIDKLTAEGVDGRDL